MNPGEDELLYDVHFWIGKYSTQDEYGTAAYKTVELDTFLDDKPIQHREVQGYVRQTDGDPDRQVYTFLDDRPIQHREVEGYARETDKHPDRQVYTFLDDRPIQHTEVQG